MKGLNRLRALLAQDEDGRKEYLYPHLTHGDVWWIPDRVTGFSTTKDQHPWVIVSGYKPYGTIITACPRTSSDLQKNKKHGILTPANALPGLDREGVFILKHRRTFSLTQFQDYLYIGKLPEPTLKAITDFYND